MEEITKKHNESFQRHTLHFMVSWKIHSSNSDPADIRISADSAKPVIAEGQFNMLLLADDQTEPEWGISPASRQRAHSRPARPPREDPFASPVAFFIDVPPEITSHNFETNKLCSVQITVRIINLSPINFFDFELETLKPTENLPEPFASMGPPQKKYVWSGTTSYHGSKLSPKQVIILNLTAVFTSPGLYNLNRLKLISHLHNPLSETQSKSYCIFICPKITPHSLKSKRTRLSFPVLRNAALLSGR